MINDVTNAAPNDDQNGTRGKPIPTMTRLLVAGAGSLNLDATKPITISWTNKRLAKSVVVDEKTARVSIPFNLFTKLPLQGRVSLHLLQVVRRSINSRCSKPEVFGLFLSFFFVVLFVSCSLFPGSNIC